MVEAWEGVSEFDWGERRIRQQERFYLIRREPMSLDAQVLEVHRAEGILDVRWWSLDEIASSDEPIMPLDLADRVAGLDLASLGSGGVSSPPR
jgi:hypothetical protein